MCVCHPCLTLRGFCVMSSRLVDSRLSFMATYRRLPSSSGIREWRSPATRGSVSRRPFWISSDKDEMKRTQDDARDSKAGRLNTYENYINMKLTCRDRQNGWFAIKISCDVGVSCQCSHTSQNFHTDVRQHKKLTSTCTSCSGFVFPNAVSKI